MAKSRKYGRTRRQRRRGGAVGTEGAPISYSLSNDCASRASRSQGGDYFKYHEGQHGGQAPLSAITNSSLPAALVGPARLNGLNQAYADIAGLQDGGRRRRRSKKHAKKHGKKHSKKHGKKHGKKRSTRRTRRRGGALGYATFPSQGMLLSGAQYAQAGLNPEWKNSVEFDGAMLRQGM